MKPIPIVGPSYNLSVRKADVQRTINLFPVLIESQTGKSPAYLKSIPGLTEFADLAGEIRGAILCNDRAFAVAGSTLYEVFADGTFSARGTLVTSSGPVDMAYGVNQLVIVDGGFGYVLTFLTNAFTNIVSSSFYGSTRVQFLDGYFIFVRPDSQQFYISNIDDATDLDALDFASAEASPDYIVSHLVDHRELWLFGSNSTEIWFNTGNSDFPFERNNGAFMEHGCAAPFSAQKLDNSVFWLGTDDRGAGIVWRAQGYTPARVSTHAIEQRISSVEDLSGAIAYTYQQDGHAFYVLQIPGLDTTLVYDVAGNAWHERSEFSDGVHSQHRGSVHLFAFGKHLLGAEDGKLYELDDDAYTNAGDVLCRERISPHYASPMYDRIVFGKLEVDCIVGTGKELGAEPQLMMRYSNDGGIDYTGWRQVGLGAIGERQARARFLRCGAARDRVWHLRFTDNAPFAIIGATA